ncbi:MAG: T9SS type A sorting domain-containing protein [Bacteroidota bacterium]
MQQFVYTTLLVAVFCAYGPLQLSAQCTPIDSIPGGAIIEPLPFTEDMPEKGIQDTACVGTEYETFFFINVPDTVNLGVVGVLPIDSATITEEGISGLPAGFSFECDSPNCVFIPNTIACIRVFGTAMAGAEGQYNLVVNTRIFSGLFSISQALPDPELAPGEYRLFVREEGNTACQPSNITELANNNFGLQLAPNPAHEETNLYINAQINAPAEVQVFDALGRQLMYQTTQLTTGDNQLRISTAELAKGLYTVVVTSRGEGVSARLIVQ